MEVVGAYYAQGEQGVATDTEDVKLEKELTIAYTQGEKHGAEKKKEREEIAQAKLRMGRARLSRRCTRQTLCCPSTARNC